MERIEIQNHSRNKVWDSGNDHGSSLQTCFVIETFGSNRKGIIAIIKHSDSLY